jgi:DNA polymerase-3 subunit delta
VTPAELRAELGRGRLRPAYLLAGGEALLRDEADAALADAVLAGAPRDFDVDRLEGAKASPAQLADAVHSLPVLAPRRLVRLREPEARGTGRGLPDALAALVRELREAGESARTVLVVVAEKPDGRSRWVQAFQEPAVRVACEPPRPGREVAEFVSSEAQGRGLRLGPGAAEALADRVGNHLLAARMELEKAALFVGEGGVVTREVVAETACDLAEQPLWDLTDAIGEGRAGDALRVLARLRAAGTAPPLVLAALASHFRRLTRSASGQTPAGPPFVRRKLESQARRFPGQRLLRCLRAIHRADEELKGEGALDPDLALERLVLGLVGAA